MPKTQVSFLNYPLIFLVLADFWEYLIKPYRDDYSSIQIALEILAVCFGIASVLFAKLRNIWVYPTGIISTCIFVYLLFQWTLYGDMLTNLYYTIMSIYGWIIWKSNSADGVHVEVKRMNSKDIRNALFFFFGAFILVLLVYYFFKRSETGFLTIDYLDAITSGIFLVGMLLMAKQKIEHWLIWILGNGISIFLYIIKGLGISAFQYLVFLILAVLGFMSWKKWLKEKEQKTTYTL